MVAVTQAVLNNTIMPKGRLAGDVDSNPQLEFNGAFTAKNLGALVPADMKTARWRT
ncbi:hypothetical protein [Mycolicibacterium farcinogenes]|uniref:Uncharacterized protein n=1 Tax=Mycolicibacterium farcinogenes TaxID=1802 RepID=A0ACD1FRA1_MYCFR|nr:hypothetical protein [Mycolicibacterium farcinogenes]QZH69445.1 hypothetical protein K6L26_30385 [Mycolicibacterium farcinogenes]